jgi:hypothetical protein
MFGLCVPQILFLFVYLKLCFVTNTNRFELQGNEQLNNNMAGLCGANGAAFCRTVCTSVRAYGGANQCGIEVKTGFTVRAFE